MTKRVFGWSRRTHRPAVSTHFARIAGFGINPPYESFRHAANSFSSGQRQYQATIDDFRIEKDDSGHGTSHTQYAGLFGKFFEAVVLRVNNIAANVDQTCSIHGESTTSGSPPMQTKAEHDQFWRGVYRQFRAYSSSDSAQPTELITRSSSPIPKTLAALQRTGTLTDPPIRDLTLIFLDKCEAAGSCPCWFDAEDFPHVNLPAQDVSERTWNETDSAGQEASTVLQGVTFDMVLNNISCAFYGQDDGTPPLFGGRNDRLRLHDICWPGTEEQPHGNNLYIYVDGCTDWPEGWEDSDLD